MKRYQIRDLGNPSDPHVVAGLVKGKTIDHGGLTFFKPGEVPHPDYHVHEQEEVFVILQGKGTMPVNDVVLSLKAGDVVVVDPGEDHHMTGDLQDPPVVLWFVVK